MIRHVIAKQHRAGGEALSEADLSAIVLALHKCGALLIELAANKVGHSGLSTVDELRTSAAHCNAVAEQRLA